MTPTRKLTAAIYVRVSTGMQKHDMQTTELRAYCDRMGWELVEYPETGSSVKKRPVFDKLMDDARLRKFDIVLVWKLDRFARSLRQLIDSVFQLDSCGVRFICVTQGIDTDKSNPVSRLMLHIFGAFAEFERGIIVERVNAGIAEAKRRGKHTGRHKRVFRRDQAMELRAAGKSLRAIAKQLGVPLSTVADALKAK